MTRKLIEPCCELSNILAEQICTITCLRFLLESERAAAATELVKLLVTYEKLKDLKNEMTTRFPEVADE